MVKSDPRITQSGIETRAGEGFVKTGGKATLLRSLIYTERLRHGDAGGGGRKNLIDRAAETLGRDNGAFLSVVSRKRQVRRGTLVSFDRYIPSRRPLKDWP